MTRSQHREYARWMREAFRPARERGGHDVHWWGNRRSVTSLTIEWQREHRAEAATTKQRKATT